MGNRTRIIHVLGQLAAGGAERFVVDLLCAMRSEGLDVELACLVPQRDAVGGRHAQQLRDAGVPVHLGPRESLRPATVVWLSRLLSAPSVLLAHLHLHYVETAYYLARFLHRRHYAVVRTIHNSASSSTGSRAALERWALSRSDVRHSLSCGSACHAVYEGTLEGDLECVPYGIHFDWARHSPIHRDDRQTILGLDPALTHYVAVGSQLGICPEAAQKGHDVLIRAWRSGELGRRGGRLHLLGDGPLRERLEALAGGDTSIVFHGIRDDVHDWLGAADTFVMPSRWEGLPLAGIEAVGSGIPTIFSDIGPLRELQTDTTRLFPMDDVEALRECLLERLGKRDSASDLELRSVRARRGIDRACEGNLSLYARALCGRIPVADSGPGSPALHLPELPKAAQQAA